MPKPFKIEQVNGGKNEYREIQGHQARNRDGSLMNYKKGTPDGDRWLIEQQFIGDDGTIIYTNYWHYSQQK